MAGPEGPTVLSNALTCIRFTEGSLAILAWDELPGFSTPQLIDPNQDTPWNCSSSSGLVVWDFTLRLALLKNGLKILALVHEALVPIVSATVASHSSPLAQTQTSLAEKMCPMHVRVLGASWALPEFAGQER